MHSLKKFRFCNIFRSTYLSFYSDEHKQDPSSSFPMFSSPSYIKIINKEYCIQNNSLYGVWHTRSYCAIRAEESIHRHVFDFSVTINYVCQSGFLYLLYHLSGISMLKPKSITISNVTELNSCDCCS